MHGDRCRPAVRSSSCVAHGISWYSPYWRAIAIDKSVKNRVTVAYSLEASRRMHGSGSMGQLKYLPLGATRTKLEEREFPLLNLPLKSFPNLFFSLYQFRRMSSSTFCACFHARFVSLLERDRTPPHARGSRPGPLSSAPIGTKGGHFAAAPGAVLRKFVVPPFMWLFALSQTWKKCISHKGRMRTTRVENRVGTRKRVSNSNGGKPRCRFQVPFSWMVANLGKAVFTTVLGRDSDPSRPERLKLAMVLLSPHLLRL
ncbi:hypothetical protein H6P81_005064 [Aristolochia fimbriata]|uniref:Uncharacterized protein n=1 Tax=Aristolochia fimbriata TaxID=158543 RepID=A0AAV7ETD9_ARIFI|nr:hypothetical protein H6P81_005064 [Aristolochia fimbriata]